MRRDGFEMQQLTPDALEAGDPAWSPNGAAIAFVDNFCFTCADFSSLYLMRSDGTMIHRITDLENNLNPSWSPDGRRIIFQYNAAIPFPPGEIYVVNRDGSSATNLTQTPDLAEYTPDWQDAAAVS